MVRYRRRCLKKETVQKYYYCKICKKKYKTHENTLYGFCIYCDGTKNEWSVKQK